MKTTVLDETNKLSTKKLPRTQFGTTTTTKSASFMPISKIDEELHLFEIKQQKSEITTTTTTTTTASSAVDDILKKIDEDNGYYGSSDYSDSTNSIKKSLKNNTNCSTDNNNNKQLYSISSPTSSTVSTETTHTSTTPSSCSTASSSPSLKQQLPAMITKQQILPTTKAADVKIYFERFERIYNSVSPDDDDKIENSHRNSLTTTCSYV